MLEDIGNNMNKRQYGGKKDVGTEHLIVTLIDSISKLPEDPKTAVVILLSYYWKGAFEKIDPTQVALKMINLGIRSSIVKVVIDFLRERKMLVKMNGYAYPSFDLIAGGLQGSLIGQLLNFIASDDVAEDIPEEIKYRYIDDLPALEAITIQGTLVEYNVCQNVPSCLALGQLFLPPDTFKLQMYNDQLFQR